MKYNVVRTIIFPSTPQKIFSMNCWKQPMVQGRDMKEHVWKVFVCILLQGKLQQAFQWVAVSDKEGILLPTYMNRNTVKLAVEVIVSNHTAPTPPTVEAFCQYDEILTLVDIVITADILEQVSKSMQGVAGLGGIDADLCQYCTLRYGPSSRDLLDIDGNYRVIALFSLWLW